MYSKNDIVQIIDASHPWYPALLIVDEIKSWGVQAYCLIPQSNNKNETAQAYNRLKYDQIAQVGHAVLGSS